MGVTILQVVSYGGDNSSGGILWGRQFFRWYLMGATILQVVSRTYYHAIFPIRGLLFVNRI